MKTVWITRTQPGAARSAKAFRQGGFRPIIAPLLLIAPAPQMPPMPQSDAVLIFTSRNGVDAFCSLSDNRDHAVITVGDATAAAARKAGFVDVTSANGTADDVSALILQNPDMSRSYCHIVGRHIRGSITEDLQAAGLSAARHVFYGSSPVLRMPEIDLSAVDVAALYSPLAAKTLAAFNPDLSGVTIMSISPATNAALGALSTHQRLIASAPNEDAMLGSLIALLRQTG